MNKPYRALISTAVATTIFAALSVANPAHAARKIHDDDVVGTEIELDAGWEVQRDPVLLETHGFAIYSTMSHDGKEHTGHDRDAIARVAIVYKARPGQLEQIVAAKMEQYKAVNPRRADIVLGHGYKAVSITGLPGARPYSVVYAQHGSHVYEIGLWSDQSGIDEIGKKVLNKIKFKQAMRSVESLGLEDAKTAAYRQPPTANQILNAKAEAERRDLVQAARSRGELAQADMEVYVPPVALSTMMSSTAQTSGGSCGFTAPGSLYWQLQWDGSNTFYSGTVYNLKNNPGWSAMSGNGGSWWGTGYHVGLCYTQQTNQYYANDWPAQRWANAYAAFSGYVEWAGWGTDGFYTLGNYVVVRNGEYRNVTAHLSGIANGIYWGAYIDGYYKVIGWVGSTGGNWAPHIHARVSWGESLTANGQPYGGQSVKPRYLRCFKCNDYDYINASGGKSYTQYYHGRWMKY